MSKWSEEFCDKYNNVGNLKRLTKEMLKDKMKDKSTLKTSKTKLGTTL